MGWASPQEMAHDANPAPWNLARGPPCQARQQDAEGWGKLPLDVPGVAGPDHLQVFLAVI